LSTVLVIALLGLLAAPAAGAVPAGDEARLRARLAPATAARVLELVREAGENGLPTGALVARALEGASRSAADDEIVAAVRRQLSGLVAARRALGGGRTSTEIVAGASALLAGVPEDSLARLRVARPEGSLAIALVVLSDLVARGVPVEQASNGVLVAARSGATDAMLLRMRERVHARIERGEAPTGAAQQGLHELLSRRPSADRQRRAPEAPERRKTP
jgi:hypothetical protein